MTDLKGTIIQQYIEEVTLTYVQDKHNLSDYHMGHINGTGLQSYMESQCMLQRAVTSKLIHGWIPTQDFLHQQKQIPSSTCPVCESPLCHEMIPHLLSCPNISATTDQEKILTMGLQQLKSNNMSPLLLECWNNYIRKEIGLPSKPYLTMITHQSPWIVNAIKSA